jgi:hypothetical protein
LINALPGYSHVNTVQHATIEKAVFFVDPTDAPLDWLDSDHVIRVSCGACPFLGYIRLPEGLERLEQLRVSSSGRSTQTRVQQASNKLEEYRRVQDVSL